MKSELQKEIRYALRSGRILILFASLLFLALLTPIMLKVVLPQVLGGEVNDLVMMTQRDCIRSYLGDVFEIGGIVIAFTLCGLTACELQGDTWLLPVCAGKRFGHMVGAKLLVFGTLLVILPVATLLVDYLYSSYLFGFEVGISAVLFSGILQSIYLVFFLSCLIMWGVFTRKPIPAGFLTLATAYGIQAISSLLRMQGWTPSGLLTQAMELNPTVDSSLLISLTVTVLLIVTTMRITMAKLKYMEWNERSAQ
jgi:hypothetical protein